MPKCECGCGDDSTRDFRPGHDQKLRAELEARVGGVLAMRAMVEAAESFTAGRLTEGAFLARVRALIPNTSTPSNNT